MKEYRIEIAKLISTELRSRTEAKRIASVIDSARTNNIVIDFSDITFMSRSFTDEFCGIVANKNITYINMSGNIKLMIDIVSKNRNNPKNIQLNGNVVDCSDMNSLSLILSTF